MLRRSRRYTVAAYLAALTLSLPGLAPAAAMSLPGNPSGVSVGSGGVALPPPDAPSFGRPRRASLASDALLFPGGDDDDYMTGGVFSLPVPLPWPPSAPGPQTWELMVPGGAPVFLLGAVTPAKHGFVPGKIALTIDGEAVAAPESYAVRGLQLPDMDGNVEHGAVAVLMPPFEPGRHAISVSCNACTAAPATPWTLTVNSGPRTYILNVQPPRQRPAASPKASAGGTIVAALPPSALAEFVPALSTGPDAGVAVDGEIVAAPIQGAVMPAMPRPRLENRAGVVLDRQFLSPALGRQLPYRVYLPASYSDVDADGQPSARRYPVVYLLHGLGAGMKQWTNLGLVAELDRLVATGQDVPFIAVMPTGRSGYWVNHADDGTRWGDFVARDLVSHIDTTLRTIATREARAIGGISMGAHGALQLSLNNPDLFGTVGAHSPALRPRSEAPAFLGGFFMNAVGGPGQEAYDERDPITLVRRYQASQRFTLAIDFGQQDRWAPRLQELHQALLQRDWTHDWRPDAGDHDNAYWRRHMADYVAYYRKALQGIAASAGLAPAPSAPSLSAPAAAPAPGSR